MRRCLWVLLALSLTLGRGSPTLASDAPAAPPAGEVQEVPFVGPGEDGPPGIAPDSDAMVEVLYGPDFAHELVGTGTVAGRTVYCYESQTTTRLADLTSRTLEELKVVLPQAWRGALLERQGTLGCAPATGKAARLTAEGLRQLSQGSRPNTAYYEVERVRIAQLPGVAEPIYTSRFVDRCGLYCRNDMWCEITVSSDMPADFLSLDAFFAAAAEGMEESE